MIATAINTPTSNIDHEYDTLLLSIKAPEARHLFTTEQSTLAAEFKRDAIDEAFGDDAKRFPNVAEKLYQMAYEDGHSAGYGEILNCLYKYDDVFKAIRLDTKEIGNG